MEGLLSLVSVLGVVKEGDTMKTYHSLLNIQYATYTSIQKVDMHTVTLCLYLSSASLFLSPFFLACMTRLMGCAMFDIFIFIVCLGLLYSGTLTQTCITRN